MARKPAKIASAKKGPQDKQHCPECDSEMYIAQLIRVSGPSGMFWLCENGQCNTLVSTAGANAGTLELK